MWTGFTETLRFIVVPFVLINMVTQHYPQLGTAFMENIKMYVIFFGGMIVASSTLEAIYRPGSYKRVLFGLSAIAFICMWFFVIFGGGVAEIHYGPYFIRFDMTYLVYIILVGLSLKSLLVLATFSEHRRIEEERARKRRVELAKARAAAARSKRTESVAERTPRISFGDMLRAEFEVSADDEIGSAPGMPPRPTPKGMKVCEVCGAKAHTKDYVCRNCGGWFPSDSIK
ncbi:MAG TPA: hypothetical protein VMY17_01205 [Thermoplasmata archaeon]|nr:hypothetical protein [Thermoplasmata archaeon]